MIIIGIVGKIGAGKSTVARRLGALGGRVIDADAIAHEVLAEPEVRAAIVDRFGSGVFDAGGGVWRPALAERVFGPTAEHARALADLEAIVHPRVQRRIEAALAALRDAGGDPVAVLDVPLLVRAGWHAVCDHIVVVTCDDAVRRSRLEARGVSQVQQAAREAAWRGNAEPGADGLPAGIDPQKTVTVDTSGDLEYTLVQVDRLWNEWHLC